MKKVYLLSTSYEMLQALRRFIPPNGDLQLFSTNHQLSKISLTDVSCILVDAQLSPKLHPSVSSILQSQPSIPLFYITDKPPTDNPLQPLMQIPQDLTLLARHLTAACSETPVENPLELLQGTSHAVCTLKTKLQAAATTTTPVLLSGQSGTGKTLAAHIIHLLSDRKKMPFFAVNVATIPPCLAESELFGTTKGAFTDAADRNGYFAAAHGGSLFLDEIGELELSLQSKLLRVFETGMYRHIGSDKEVKTDVRLLFATNRDLRALVKKQLFRQDLYYRISKLVVHVPALSERVEDIPAISQAFLAKRYSFCAYHSQISFSSAEASLEVSCSEAFSANWFLAYSLNAFNGAASLTA